MNQEKIMKRKMYIAIVISLILAIALSIFIALYIDEKRQTQLTYKKQYSLSMTQAYDEMSTYLDKKTDLSLHYNMIVADLGSARDFIFLIDDYSEKNKTTINELFYCFVKYPEQMTEKLSDTASAMDKIVNSIDSGYDEITQIIESVNKKGT